MICKKIYISQGITRAWDLLQSHKKIWMRKNGAATEAGTDLGPLTTICGFALKIVLYIYIQTVLTHHTHTHTQTAVAKWRHNRAEASGKPWVQTQHRLLRVVCIPPTWGSSSRRRPFICIHSYETKSWNLSVMRLTFLLCCCERCSECSFRENAIGFPLELSCLWIMHRGRRMEAGGVKEKGCYESHNCLVKRLDGELEAA